MPKNHTPLIGNKSSLNLWFHAIEEMYNNPKLLYCDDYSVRLYPLCAYSMEPIGDGIEILHPTKQIKEMSFALQLSASILSSIALYSTAVSMLIPSLYSSIQSSLRYVTALQMSLSITDGPGNILYFNILLFIIFIVYYIILYFNNYFIFINLGITTITNEPSVIIQSNYNHHESINNNNNNLPNETANSCIPLDSPQLQIFKQIEEAYKNGQDIHTVLNQIPPEQFAQIKPVANESYKMIRSILDHVDPGLKHLRTLMAPCLNIYCQDIQWVKIEHINDWKYCKLSPYYSNNNPIPQSHSHEILPHHQISTNPHKLNDNNILIHQQFKENHNIDNVNVDNVISYDPWVLVHPPHVSSQDCEDVERLSKWFQSEVHLLHSTSEFISTKLVIDNCPHIERLKTRLFNEPNYLKSLGISEEDSKDIYHVIFHSSTSSSSFRSWCIIS